MPIPYKKAKNEVDAEYNELIKAGWNPIANDDGETFRWENAKGEIRRGVGEPTQGVNADASWFKQKFKREARQDRLMSEKVTAMLAKKPSTSGSTSTGSGATSASTGSTQAPGYTNDIIEFGKWATNNPGKPATYGSNFFKQATVTPTAGKETFDVSGKNPNASKKPTSAVVNITKSGSLVPRAEATGAYTPQPWGAQTTQPLGQPLTQNNTSRSLSNPNNNISLGDIFVPSRLAAWKKKQPTFKEGVGWVYPDGTVNAPKDSAPNPYVWRVMGERREDGGKLKPRSKEKGT